MVDSFSPPITEGTFLRLRPLQLLDAEYIHGLRMNAIYNRHLSPVSGAVDEQRVWIERYKDREAKTQELYYIIERCDTGIPCGTVRLYDIGSDHFTWGSWILDQNKSPKAALESALLVYDVGFTKLGCARAVFDVRLDNERTLSFHRRFGAREIGADELNVYFEYTRKRFDSTRASYVSILKKLERDNAARKRPTDRPATDTRSAGRPDIY